LFAQSIQVKISKEILSFWQF